MAHVTVDLPRLLAPAAGGDRHVDVDAATVGDALDALLDAHPRLRVHLFDDRGGLRANVLCAVDGEPTRLSSADRQRPVSDGSHVTFVGSVAGG